jgi:hypothetical protein
MYGLPRDFDATVFVGRELITISFSANTIHLAFSDNISITLTSSFVYCDASSDACLNQTIPVRSSNLMHLIGQTVDTATATPDGTLALVFDNGNSLTCLDDLQNYESYSICIGDREIFV